MRAERLAAFLGSFLAFWLELSTGKALLPLYGGGAFVWTTSLMVFQGLVLAAALYALCLRRIAEPRLRRAFHLLLLVAAAAAPLAPRGTPAAGVPAAGLAIALLRAVGAPFAILACVTAVLEDGGGREAYAASNAGALAGLAAYPLLLEPLLPLSRQRLLWRAGYAVFAFALWRCRPSVEQAAEEKGQTPQAASWLLLAAAPSAALLAATNALGLDLAAGPMLWAIPLGLYLATLVLAFRSRRPRLSTVLAVFAAGACLWLVLFGASETVSMLRGGGSTAPRALLFAGKAALDLGALFLLGLACHGALAASRPEGRREPFYAWIAAGAWLGSVLVALALPVIARGSGIFTLDWLIAGALGVAAAALASGRGPLLAGAASALAAFAAGATLWTLPASSRRVYAVRNFYGIYTVTEGEGARDFYHGNTRHGRQWLEEGRRRAPTGYFSAAGPIGRVFETLGPRFRRVGVVGLGVGTMAAYARPGQDWVFYELDPDVVELARSRFDYLSDCPASWRVTTGDARLALERTPDRYDLLVLDAFHSDAMPIHLATREAAQVYLEHLAPGGVLLFHVSSRYLDLRPIFAGLAREVSLAGTWTHAERSREVEASTWVALAREPESLAPLGWRPLAEIKPARAWTDEHASLLPAVFSALHTSP